ncbi:MAG: hypothetical protein ACKO1U_00710 [Bacteroidota bacterium]
MGVIRLQSGVNGDDSTTGISFHPLDHKAMDMNGITKSAAG